MLPFKKSLKTSPKRKIDKFFEIKDLFSDHNAKFDIVYGDLNGPHGKFINNQSDKAYFILEGNGIVFIDNDTIDVEPMDFIYISKGSQHGLKGKIKFLIITSPPFNPEHESVGDEIE